MYFLKIMLLNFGVTLLLMIPIVLLVAPFSGQNFVEKIGPATTIFVPTLALALVAAAWGLLINATVVVSVSRVVSGQSLEVGETIKVAWKSLGRYFLTSLLMGIIVAIGFVLLIIPGIVFWVWYSFALYFVVTQGLGPRDALKASKKLVRGHFWAVLGRLAGITVFFLILQTAVGYIRFLGPIAVGLFSPYFVLAPYILFEELKRISAEASA